MGATINNRLLYETMGKRANITYVTNEITKFIESKLIKEDVVKMTVNGGHWFSPLRKESGDVFVISTHYDSKDICHILTDGKGDISYVEDKLMKHERVEMFGSTDTVKEVELMFKDCTIVHETNGEPSLGVPALNSHEQVVDMVSIMARNIQNAKYPAR